MNKLQIKNSRSVLTPLALALAASSVLAAGAVAETQSDEWKFRANIYGWLPSLEGETTFKGSGTPNEEVEVENILSEIEGAFMGGIAASKGNWGIFTDYIYVDLSDTRNNSLSFDNSIIPTNLDYKTALSVTGWVWNTAATYALVDNSLFTVKVLGGVRFLDLEEEFKWDLASDIGGVPVGSRSGKISVKDSFVDAIVGVRGKVKLGDTNWSAPYYVDLGTGQTDFTLQAVAGINYAFESVDLTLSYRHLEWDFESGEPLQSLSFSGLQFGVAYRW